MIITYEFSPKASPKKPNEVITRFASLDFLCGIDIVDGIDLLVLVKMTLRVSICLTCPLQPYYNDWQGTSFMSMVMI